MKVISRLQTDAVVKSPMVVKGRASSPFVMPVVFRIEASPAPSGAANIFIRETDGAVIGVEESGNQVVLVEGKKNG